MKKRNLLLLVLSSVFVLSACGGNTPQSNNNNNNNGNGQTNNNTNNDDDGSVPKIKEIALKSTARTTLSVTDRIGTSALYEIKANKGKTLKTADKKVKVTSSDPEVLKVENTNATTSTFIEALKPGPVKLTIQSNVQEEMKLEIDITVVDSVFDRQAMDGFFGNSWENCDLSHEVDEENPYIQSAAEDGINHQFYFRDSFTTRCYAECEFTFYSELDGTAHLPKLGFVFSTNDDNDTDLQSVSFIYFDTDCRNNNSTFYNVGYNEIASGMWGWDQPGNPLAKSCGLFRYEAGVKVGEMFKMGVIKDGYNYHVFFNGEYYKSIESTRKGFSVDSTYNEAAPTICGMFDFKAEVKYSNYLFTTDESVISSKMPAEPSFVD